MPVEWGGTSIADDRSGLISRGMPIIKPSWGGGGGCEEAVSLIRGLNLKGREGALELKQEPFLHGHNQKAFSASIQASLGNCFNDFLMLWAN